MGKNYGVSEAAKMLGYSRNSLYSFLKRGKIKGIRVGRGKFRISQEEIDRFMSVGVNVPEKAVVAEPEELVLTEPRPGKSLEDLSGEALPNANLMIILGEDFK